MSKDSTVPDYKPKHVPSPEFRGTSNYEVGLEVLLSETKENLEKMRADPETTPKQLHRVGEDLKTLEYLYENYYLGMNVFRTAKDGRKISE